MEIKWNKQRKLIKFYIRQCESYLHLKLKQPIQFIAWEDKGDREGIPHTQPVP